MIQDKNVKIIKAKGKRGGQSGNTNALRHGFYARNLGVMSPDKYDLAEINNLLGEAAMLKDYMYILYNRNIEDNDPTVLIDTLRALSLAGMALARLLQVNGRIRISSSGDSSSSLDDFLGSMNAAASRANSLASGILGKNDEDDLED